MFVKSVSGTDTIATASVLILSPNNQRRGVAIVNSGAIAIWMSKSQTAVVGAGILLNALGGAYTDERDADGAIYTGPYSAIAASGSNVLGHQEDYFEN